jgi:beta-mannosidase
LIPKFTVWGQSNIKQTVRLVLKAYDMVASKYIEMPSREVTLLPNKTTELGEIEVPNLTEDSLIITSATLVGSAPLARTVNWPEPFRYLNWHKDTKVKVEVIGENVEVSANYPVKGLLLSVDGDEEVEWEDNMLDLMPGETLGVGIKGLNGREIKRQFLNDWEL